MGIATMYGGLTLQPGDDVLSTTHDFYSTEAASGCSSDAPGPRSAG